MQTLAPQFDQMVSDMKDMVSVSMNKELATYDLIREESGEVYGYPVVFVKDSNGQWKISDF